VEARRGDVSSVRYMRVDGPALFPSVEVVSVQLKERATEANFR
jgi:hypothetical protein